MRALAIALPLLAACDPVPDLDGLNGCGLAPAGECVDGAHPFRFSRDNPTALARSGRTAIVHLALQTIDYEIVSANPEILQVEEVDVDHDYEMIGVADGTATLQAFRIDGGTRQLLASAEVEVEAITQVDFGFDPAGNTQLPRLAALAGAREKLRIHALGASQQKLAGAPAALTFAYEGSVSEIAPRDAETRMGRFDLFAAGRSGFEIAFRADAIGPGRVVARASGRELGALPIEVVATADTVDLVISADQAPVGGVALAGLAGTANGVPLAGLVGDFTLAPPGLVDAVDLHAGELVMITKAAGILEIQASVAGRTLVDVLEIR